MADEFANLSSRDDWSTKLETLLEVAQGARTSAERVTIQNRLAAYIRRSPLFAMSFDRIASGAIDDLAEAQLGEAVSSIAARTSELARLTKEINAVTAEAAEAASLISLKPVINATRSLTELVAALKEARSGLTSGEQLDQIDSVVKAARKLRDSIEDLAGAPSGGTDGPSSE